MLVEVCVDSLESATNAVCNGADELEVCSSLMQDGLTPSLDLVKEIIEMIEFYMTNQKNLVIKKPMVNVMIRCREGWDFVYNDCETALMLEQISQFKSLKVDRFVFGGLTTSREVDISTCKKIIAQAYPKPVTFHRAFDRTDDPIKAIEDIIQLGFNRVLTSGQKDLAAAAEAVDLIRNLINTYGNKIQIMPGAGVSVNNVQTFKDIGCEIVHGTFKNEKLISTENVKYITDGEIVKRVKDILNS